MAAPEISKETEQQIAEFQNAQSALQLTMVQRQQVQLQMDEIDNALEELKKSTGAVYRAVGTVLVESKKDETVKELTERKDTLAVRLNVLTKQEEKLRSKLTELRAKIEGSAGAG
ncbi:MAG: prefoldin subunit beta, partial [Candidatus Micrarchaeota archaeon]